MSDPLDLKRLRSGEQLLIFRDELPDVMEVLATEIRKGHEHISLVPLTSDSCLLEIIPYATVREVN